MAEITLLDGGMGQELIHRAGDNPTPLWSTQVMMDFPGLVGEIHKDFAEAGATVATTNTYAIHRDRLRSGSNHYASDGQPVAELEHQFEALLHAAMAEADAVRGMGRVAGSIGPLGASYRADLYPDLEVSTQLYAEVARLIAPRSDVLLFETLPSCLAGQAALAAGRTTDKPVWLAFTLNDSDGTLLRSGERLEDALQRVSEADALLVNCSVPEAIPAALDVLATVGPAFGAYANGFTKIEDAFIKGGTTVAALSARQDLSPTIYAEDAMRWIEQGATLIGGCCEVGPAHIREIARQAAAAGHILI